MFITVFTRDVFLSQIHIEMGTALDEATRKLDMWKSVNPTESLHGLTTTRPLLQVIHMRCSICLSLYLPKFTTILEYHTSLSLLDRASTVDGGTSSICPAFLRYCNPCLTSRF